jgi:sugar lactone lactonase YvrE
VRFLEYQGLIDFRGYLAWQTARIERDTTYPPALYVDQRIALTVGQDEALRDNALDAFAELLDSEHSRFVLVLGDFGTGKTFLLHELARRMGKAGGALTPVLIEMRALEKARDLNALIAQHLALAGMGRIDLAAFRHMLAEGRIALLFDGFDELAFRVTYDRAVEHFDTLIQAAQGKVAKVVVTSRSQHFVSEQQVKSALAERAAMLPGYRLAKLQPFTEAQIRRSLVNRLGDDGAADARMRLLADVKDLLGLSANPRMLGFIAEIEEAQHRQAKAGDREITSAGLYKLLLDRWLVWEYERAHPKGAQPGLSVAQRWWAVTELAMRLWQRTERSVNVRELPAELIAALQALGKHELDLGITAHQIGSGTLLVWDEEESFRFIHQSVLEWLVAREAAEQVKRCGEAAALAHRDVSDLMADFFAALAGREAAIAWAQRTLDDGGAGEVAVHNALRVLRRLRVETRTGVSLAGRDLRGEDFSGRSLRGADLTGADLTGTRLVGADLMGASLRRANMARADLSRANIARAHLAGADLSFARLLGADLRGTTLVGARLRYAGLVGAKLDAGALDGVDVFGAAPAVPAHVEVVTANMHPHVEAMAFSPDGALLASSHQDGSVWLWDLASGEPIRFFGHRFRPGEPIAFSPDGHTLACASSYGTVTLWDVASGGIHRVFENLAAPVRSIAWSPVGLILASAPADMTVTLLDVASGNVLRMLESGSQVRGMAFSPDGKTLAAVSEDMLIRIWDVATGKLLHVFKSDPGCTRVVAWSPDGRSLASACSDGSIHVWDVAAGDVLRTLSKGHEAPIRTLTFTLDGRTLISGSDDGSVVVWDAATDGMLHRAEAPGNEAFPFANLPPNRRRALPNRRRAHISSVAHGPNGDTVARPAHPG